MRRPLLSPLVPLYAAGLRWKNRRFDNHRTLAKSLRDPVLSVGSLSAGGAGKTPFLMALAGLVREIGYAPDVLSRGYGRTSRGVLRVDPHGPAETFGDEPLMLAQVLGCPVYVGSERYEAGKLAEREGVESGRGLHLLDDGFGHRRLARTIDIVLLTAEELRDTLLPAGNLREPLGSLRRADIVVVRAGEEAEVRPVLDQVALECEGTPFFREDAAKEWGNRSGGPSLREEASPSNKAPTPVWVIERRMTLPAQMPARPFVFSGIARPRDLEAMLAARDVTPAGVRRFRDHHRYSAADVEAMLKEARAVGADGFLTTSKDAVKLDSGLRERLLQAGPLAVADAVVVLRDRERYADDLRRLLRERTRLGTFVVGPERVG